MFKRQPNYIKATDTSPTEFARRCRLAMHADVEWAIAHGTNITDETKRAIIRWHTMRELESNQHTMNAMATELQNFLTELSGGDSQTTVRLLKFHNDWVQGVEIEWPIRNFKSQHPRGYNYMSSFLSA